MSEPELEMERRRGGTSRGDPQPLIADVVPSNESSLAPLPPPPPDSNAPITLSIITPGTGVRVSVSICPSDTVATLKTRAAAALNSPRGQFLRLIASGKMLAPDDAKLLAFGGQLRDHAVVHAVLSDTQPVALSPQQLQVLAASRRAGGGRNHQRRRGGLLGFLSAGSGGDNSGRMNDDGSSDSWSSESGTEGSGGRIGSRDSEENQEEDEDDDDGGGGSGEEALGLLEAGAARRSSSSSNSNSTTRPLSRRGENGDASSRRSRSSGNTTSTTGSSRPRLGFDRLRDHGLSREEVESLRVFFGAQALEHAATRGPRWSQPQEGESTRRTRARLEEAWIETQAAAGEFGANFLPAPGMNNGNTNGTTGDGAGGNGNGISGRMLAGNRLLQFGTPTDVFGNPVGFNNQDRDDPRGLGTMDPNNPMARGGSPLAGELLGEPKDFVVGFLMGFFLGIIMLFWVWERGPYRQKLGIMCGVSCQLLLRFLKRDSDDRLGVVPSSPQGGIVAAASANGHFGQLTSGNNTTTAAAGAAAAGVALLGNQTGIGSGEAAAAAAGAALERAASGGGSGSAANGSDHYEDFFSIMGR